MEVISILAATGLGLAGLGCIVATCWNRRQIAAMKRNSSELELSDILENAIPTTR